MQKTSVISNDGFRELIDLVFDGQPTVYESYSRPGKELQSFHSSEQLRANFESRVSEGDVHVLYDIYYPECKGFILTEKISLNPSACDGQTFRYKIGGWGLIALQLDFRRSPNVSCRIAVNSKERADMWSDVGAKLKDVALWDWKMVEKNASRLIRRLKKLELKSQVGDGAQGPNGSEGL